MTIISPVLIMIFCFFLMSKIIAHLFIKTLDGISDKLELSPSVEGATLMAFGTSAPELSTNLIVMFLPGMHSNLGLGAIVGAALFQTLVVIGISAIIRDVQIDWRAILRDIFFYAISIILLILVTADGNIQVVEGFALVTTYVIYLLSLRYWSNHIKESSEPDALDIIEEEVVKEEKRRSHYLKYVEIFSIPVNFLIGLLPDPNKRPKWVLPMFLFSLVLIGSLSYLIVSSAEMLAVAIGVPSVVIALTVIAGGGALPELIASVIVANDHRTGMAISNALGSNTFDILISFGLPVFIYNMFNGSLENIGHENITTSIFLLFATLLTTLILLVIQHFKLTKWFGIVLILLYVAYVAAAYFGLL